MKVTLKGFIEVPEAELDTAKKELKAHTKLTLEEPGCITFSVVQNAQIPTQFDVYEEFESQVDFDYHQERAKNSAWGSFSKNLKRNYEIFSG